MSTPTLRTIRTFDGVVAALGGTNEAARLLRRNNWQICKWRQRHGLFPAETYRLVRHHLRRRGHDAPLTVFKFDRVA